LEAGLEVLHGVLLAVEVELVVVEAVGKEVPV
jgi:hypothetical protein